VEEIPSQAGQNPILTSAAIVKARSRFSRAICLFCSCYIQSIRARLERGAFGARQLMYQLALPIPSGVSSSRSAALRSTKQLSTLYQSPSVTGFLLGQFRIHSTTKEIAKCGTPRGLVHLIVFSIRILLANGNWTDQSCAKPSAR